MTTDIRQLIINYHQNHTLFGFHCDHQTEDRFYAGYAEAVEPDQFLIRYVNTAGQPEKGEKKTAWFEYSEVVWIEANTAYLIAVEKMHQVHERFAHLKASRWRPSPKSILRDLKACAISGEVCRVRFDDSDSFARVASIGKDYVCLTCYMDDGAPDGERLTRIDAIKGIQAGGMDEAAMAYLVDVHAQ